MKICQYTDKVAIYGKKKKCWNNAETSFSNSKIWPGKLKIETEY